MHSKPLFPTEFHLGVAELVKEYFSMFPEVDTILVVNSCARGQAVAESDLDFAILARPNTNPDQIKNLEQSWLEYSSTQEAVLKYKSLSQFAHIHLDVIDGQYHPGIIENGEPIDYFEIEIGNQVFHSAPLGKEGEFFQELKKKWSPYYDEALRAERLKKLFAASHYDLDQVSFLVKRKLYFHAFDILYKGFQKYLQALFIVNKTYPIAYNKWIREQVVNWLKKPDLYTKLAPILSINNIESDQIIENAGMLRALLSDLAL